APAAETRASANDPPLAKRGVRRVMRPAAVDLMVGCATRSTGETRTTIRPREDHPGTPSPPDRTGSCPYITLHVLRPEQGDGWHPHQRADDRYQGPGRGEVAPGASDRALRVRPADVAGPRPVDGPAAQDALRRAPRAALLCHLPGDGRRP